MAERTNDGAAVANGQHASRARRVLRRIGRWARGLTLSFAALVAIGWITLRVSELWGQSVLTRRMTAARELRGGRQFYVDANGSDASDGRSRSHAWRSLVRASRATFEPGDSLILTGGDVFEGTLHLDRDDGGDPRRPFVVTSTGAAPATIMPAHGDGIVARDPIGLVISRLIVRGSGALTSTGSGINLLVTTPGAVQLPGIVVEQVDVSGMGRFGMVIDARWLKSGLRDVLIADADFHANQLAGLSINHRTLSPVRPPVLARERDGGRRARLGQRGRPVARQGAFRQWHRGVQRPWRHDSSMRRVE